VWQARASRVWKRYLRVAAAVAGLLGTAVLTIMYFVVLAPFAWLAKRAERRDPVGWTPIAHDDSDSPASQY
jgi:predicted LPLAT superfamily acyltransferase